MLYCERGTSLLFPPIDKVIQVYSCRVVEFLACPGKNKRIQKDTKCKDDCVGPTHNNFETVCVDTDLLETSSTSSNSQYNSTETLTEPTEDKMQSTDDTLNDWEPPLIRNAKLSKRGKQDEFEHMQQDNKKMRRRRRKGQVSRAAQSCKNPVCLKSKKEGYPSKMLSKLVNTKQSAFNKNSLISLYRKRRRSKLKRDDGSCLCPGGVNQDTLDEFSKNKNGKRRRSEKTNFKLELKPKNGDNQGKDARKNENDKICYKGICTKAVKNKDKDFECTCSHKKEPGVICSDTTCNIDNVSSFARLKDRVSYLYRKSLQKFKISRKQDFNKICEEGFCTEASKRKNPNISCICKQKIKKCSDDTCTPGKSKLDPKGKRRTSRLSQKLRNGLRKRVCQSDKIRENIVVQNEMEQTGDPLFEIKVNAIDMCVLNPSEIKDKVVALGEKKKRHHCVCPSHAVRKRYILEREACLGGACQRALKNKKTDFTCKCLKNKIWTCTDSTCNKAVTFGENQNCPAAALNCMPNQNKIDDQPLFEVRVDNNNMCIINTEEMRYKMDDIHRRKNELCSTGICRDKSRDRNTRIRCKCHKEMAYDECMEHTCGDTTKKCCKCGRDRHKMIRSSFDTASIKNIKSKFSIFCARMCSKSDNLINQSKTKKTRTNKRRNIMVRTQSENVHKRDGLKLIIKKHNPKENEDATDPNNDSCCPCSLDKTLTTPNDDVKTKLKKIEKSKDVKKAIKPDKKKIKSEIVNKQEDNEQVKNKVKVMKAKKNEKVEIDNTALKPRDNEEADHKEKKLKSKNKYKSKNKVNDEVESSNNVTSKEESVKKPPAKAIKEKKVRKKKEIVVPVPIPKVEKKPKVVIKKKPDATCLCDHMCECHTELQKRRMKESKKKSLHRSRKKYKRKKPQKKKKDTSKEKDWERETLEKRKYFEKEKDKMAKAEEARQKKRFKEEMEVIRLLESEGGARRSNCFVEILVAILSAAAGVIRGLLFALFKVITKPKKSYWYVRERLNDVNGTIVMIKKTIIDAWRIRKLKISKCFKNSETVSVLSDAFKESIIYHMFEDKGKTRKEQQVFEIESRARKKRIKRRRESALYGCRHVLLNTLRKTPCLWVYHVCPEFYPQCLSLLQMIRQFWHMILFVAALACWTPCIVACEVMRGLCCCLLCTG